MKKILSFVLVVIMIMSTLVVSTGAAGSLIFNDDFNMGFKPLYWIQGASCEFKWDQAGQCLVGYNSAVVLQNNYTARDPKMWDKFYSSYDVQVRDFDDLDTVRESHSIGMWFRDLFENESGSQGLVYTFFIEIETGKATLKKDGDFKYKDANGITQEGKIDALLDEATIPGAAEAIEAGKYPIEIGEDAPWYELGMRVTDGKIECYLNQQLILSAEADPEDEKLGNFTLNSADASLGSQRSPILFWNVGNYVAVDNFEVWTEDYDFAAVTYGDVDGNGKINLGDVSAMLKKIAKYDVTIDEAAADVDGNSKLNLADVSLVLKYIAKWDVTLGK